jgi:predicted nucleic acid-binding protein
VASGPVVVLDANVIYPARLRDLFIRLSIGGLIQAKWSERILDECFDNLIADRPDLDTSKLARTRQLMATAVPAATHIDRPMTDLDDLDLPDLDDRHVLATAIAANADHIVTANLKDFPSSALEAHDISALSPDQLVVGLLAEQFVAVRSILNEQASSLTRPPMTLDELLDLLIEVGLDHTVSRLRAT